MRKRNRKKKKEGNVDEMLIKSDQYTETENNMERHKKIMEKEKIRNKCLRT